MGVSVSNSQSLRKIEENRQERKDRSQSRITINAEEKHESINLSNSQTPKLNTLETQ